MFTLKLIDLTGQKFGLLTVLSRADNTIRPSGQVVTRWHCRCQCGTEKDIDSSELRKGKVQSCGCLSRKLSSERKSKTNTYNLSGNVGIGYTVDGEQFYFDKEDYDKIKDYYWRVSTNGYIINSKVGLLHRFIMNCPTEYDVDHIKSSEINNNCKSNLQLCTVSQNISKKRMMKINSSGIIGVSWSKTKLKWLTRLNKENKCVYLCYFDNKDDAIKARLQAESKFYKEYAPQKHLFKQYGVPIDF